MKGIIELIKSNQVQCIINDTTRLIRNGMYDGNHICNIIPVLYIDSNKTVFVNATCDYFKLYRRYFGRYYNKRFLFIYDKDSHYIIPRGYDCMIRCGGDESITTEIVSENHLLKRGRFKIPFYPVIPNQVWNGIECAEFIIDDIVVIVYSNENWNSFNTIYENIRKYAKIKMLNTSNIANVSKQGISSLLDSVLEYFIYRIKFLDQKSFTNRIVYDCRENSIICLKDYIDPIYRHIDKWIEKNKTIIVHLIESTKKIDGSVKFIKIKCYGMNGESMANTNIKRDSVRVNIAFDPSLEGNRIKYKFISMRHDIYRNIQLQLNMRGVKHEDLKLLHAVIQTDGCIELVYTMDHVIVSRDDD